MSLRIHQPLGKCPKQDSLSETFNSNVLSRVLMRDTLTYFHQFENSVPVAKLLYTRSIMVFLCNKSFHLDARNGPPLREKLQFPSCAQLGKFFTPRSISGFDRQEKRKSFSPGTEADSPMTLLLTGPFARTTILTPTQLQLAKVMMRFLTYF